MKKYFIILLTLFLSSCSTFFNLNSAEFNKVIYDKGGKSYIILGASNDINRKGLIPNNFFEFTNVDNGKKFRMFIMNGTTKGFMIEPGKYYITRYSMSGSRIYGNQRQSVDLDLSNSIKGNFSVAENEAIYLGFISAEIKRVEDQSKLKEWFSGKTKITHKIKIENLYDKLTETEKDKFKNESGKEIKIKILNLKTATLYNN